MENGRDSSINGAAECYIVCVCGRFLKRESMEGLRKLICGDKFVNNW